MKRHSLIAAAFLVLAAVPFLFMITPASAESGHPLVAASGSASGSHKPPPPPIPSGSASSHKK
jgi:hypothetical protein